MNMLWYIQAVMLGFSVYCIYKLYQMQSIRKMAPLQLNMSSYVWAKKQPRNIQKGV